MMKNYLLTTFGAMALSLSLVSCTKEETKPVQPVQPEKTTIEHTLQTTDGEENAELSSKVLELATLVLTKEKGDYIIESDEYGIFACTRFEENGKGYFLIVSDIDESKDIVSIPENPIMDGTVLFEFSLENEGKDKRCYGLANLGLNGHVYSGVSFLFENDETGLVPPLDFNPSQQELRELIRYDYMSGETENKELFDKKFEELVNTLLAIYKRE